MLQPNGSPIGHNVTQPLSQRWTGVATPEVYMQVKMILMVIYNSDVLLATQRTLVNPPGSMRVTGWQQLVLVLAAKPLDSSV